MLLPVTLGHTRLSCRGDSAVTEICDFHQLLAWDPVCSHHVGQEQQQAAQQPAAVTEPDQAGPAGLHRGGGTGTRLHGVLRRLPGPSGGETVWGGNVPEDSFPTACKPAALRAPQPLKHSLRPVASGFMPPPRRGLKRLRPRHSSLVPEI